MANPEHLEIIKHGANVWNRWRGENSNLKPDLSGVSFEGVDFNQINFFETDLSHTHFSFVNLQMAYLRYAKLNGASIYDSDLSRANINKAVFSNAHLIQVNLRGAKPIEADFNHASFGAVDFHKAQLGYSDLRFARFVETNLAYASLIKANFENAHFNNTLFGDTDLSGAIGLATCSHGAPSVLDIQTILKSGGLPLEFLRGCGLPDTFIKYLPSLLNDPLQFYSCFISYSSKDQDFADRLYADLQNKGVRCWFAPEDLKIGDSIRDRIDESIRLRDKLLLVLSESSIESEWVEHEVESALEEEKHRGRTILFPIRLDNAVMESSKAWAALIRRTRHIGDFTRWKDHDSYQKAFARLLRDLKAEEKGDR
ncbi:MAG: toll/interleukin-1 receptor domain-containing protein [Pyrinomonadaceae bacterium]